MSDLSVEEIILSELREHRKDTKEDMNEIRGRLSMLEITNKTRDAVDENERKHAARRSSLVAFLISSAIAGLGMVFRR